MNKLLNLFKKFRLRQKKRILFFLFDFNKWHISLLEERKYAQDIIKYLNLKSPDFQTKIVEIGCGLAEIIRKANYIDKTGVDYDVHVLKAAKYLSRIENVQGIKFQVFNFPESRLKGKFNVILMVNWIHNIQSSVLKENLELYFNNNLSQNGEIIIDIIEKNKNYKFNHLVDFLISELNCSKECLGTYDGFRKIWIIRKN